MPRVALWDFDETLAFRPGRWSGVMLELLEDEGADLEVSRDDLRVALREGFPWHTPEEPHPHLGEADAWWDHVNAGLARAYERVGVDGETARRLAAGVRSRYTRAEDFHLFPDTLAALTRLRASGWRHVILSNHVPELHDIVQALGLHELVDAVLSSAHLGVEKPHPQAFLAAIAACGGAETIVMVGDNVEADIRGAEAVGLPALLVRGPHPDDGWAADDLHLAAKQLEERFGDH